ncbi:MAG TPA: SDR family NAD(P)-dependent oxidoreductase [Thermoanaerobaculia bacterium]|nr:SDR family NAD(P)-dependent oxidoreductase [Thermoanaerobaculia bacterium]
MAAVNAAARVVVSGEAGEIERLAARLDQRGISHRRLATAHAFHSAMMEPILAGFAAELERIARHPPRIPFVSNLSGTWIRPGEAVDPAYWVRHLRGTVRFADGIGELWREPRRCLLELGPGDELAAFARRHPARREDQPVIAALGGRHGGAGAAAETERGAAAAALTALGDLWLAGAEVRWEALHSGTRRRRVRLPSYPFARQRHWVEPRAARALPPPGERAALDDWFYTLGWRRAPVPGEAPGEPAGGPGHGPALGPALAADACCLVLVDRRGVGERLAQRLAGEGRTVIRAETGAAFRRLDPRRYALAPLRREDFDALLAELRAAGQVPSAVVHLWSLDAAAATPAAPGAAGIAAQADGAELAFHSLLLLAQSLAASTAAGAGGEAGAPPVRLLVVTAGAQAVPAGGGEVDEPHPEQAPALGLARVIARESPGLACSAVDLPPRVEDAAWAAAALCAELARDGKEPGVAYRDGERWQERIEPVRLAAVPATARRRLRERGVYLITGGLGGVGHVLARALAQAVSARLVLVGRTPLASGADSADRERKRRRLRELQELGAEVLALQADVADRQQMAAALGQARERFGAIHGVIHAAGVAGGGIIQTRTAAAAGSVLAPKIRGALVLADLLAGSDLDFLVLCSSLESALGSIGQGDYCAANRFLDAFAHRRLGSFTAAIGWDTWRETGMAVDTPVPAALRPARERSLALGMDDAEAVEVFWRVLGGDLPQVWVSTRDLHRRLAAASGGVATAPATAATTPSRPAVWSGPSHHLERRIAGVWSEVLGIPDVAADVSFFDLGGDSLLALGLAARLSRELGFEVPALLLFEAPTVSALAARLAAGSARGDRREGAGRQGEPAAASGDGIAIIGMAGRLPGARDLEELWRNLHDGVESITAFSREELAAAGVPGALLADPRYVRARPRLAACEWFDAGFFGFSPREAEITDPQHRVFLECAWEALESAGYDPAAYAGRIAVVAGSGAGAYLANLVSRPDLLAMTDPVQVSIGNDKDALSTSVSYRLDLRGPSLTVQTFCSTGLVAVHTARRLLLDGECDVALAGAVSIGAVEPRGYLCQEGGILSPDGHVRAFDARAQGTVFGDGAGVVVLKRLAEALRDGDTVRAVIRGSAVNNDGAQKIGFAAPNVEGQAAVIAAALASAGLGPEAISYVEAHGTGTALGDPIEVSALHRVFATPGRSPGSCALGSVKTNLGHLDRAAGMASLFKAVLALEHATIPPTLHFSRPNPRLDLAAGPFFVNTAPLPWVSKEAPRRAGVTSLGFGGTNAHLVIEEAPPAAAGEPRRDRQLIVLSAKSATALERIAVALAGHLRAHPELDLADVAYTCQVCRSRFSHRRFVIAGDPAEAVAALEEMPPPVAVAASRRELVFLLPAAGDEELGAIADLAGPLRAEPVLREELAACREALRQQLDPELLAAADALWSGAGGGGSPGGVRPAVAEPALCAVEIALGRHWLAWGLAPVALLGSGVGELAADCLAGRLTREEALAAAATRGRRLEEAAAGAEPPAAAGEGQSGPGLLAELFRDPDRVLFDVGPGGTLGTLARDHPNRPAAQTVVLGGGGVATARLPRAPLLEALGHLWLLGERPDWEAFHAPARRRRVPLPTYPFERRRYWIAAAPDRPAATRPGAAAAGGNEAAAAQAATAAATAPDPLARRDDLADWFYLPRWVPAPPAGAAAEQPPAAESWLLFADALGLGERIAARLAAAGHGVMLVRPGDRCGRAAGAAFVIDPRRRGDYDALLAELAATSGPPRRILHLWGLGGGPVAAPAAPLEPLAAGFYSLLLLAQALSAAAGPDALRGVHLGVVSDRAVAVTASEESEPRKAAALGPCQVLPKEHPGLRCVAIDVVLPPPGSRAESELIDRLIAEVADPAAPARVAWRGRQRLELAFAPLRLAAPAIRPAALRHRGVVLITGGLGGIGLALAEGLAREASARLVLVGRTPLPPRRQWESWLAEQGEADPVSRKLRAILALERLGAEVLPLAADAADAAAMGTVVDTARRRLGGLHGVIHAAGVPGGGLLRWRSPEAAARVLAPKVAGTAALLAALAGLDLDFFVACSSLESVLGSYGQADYYAANAALEAFTHAAARSGCPAVAIAWDAWQEVGMAAAAASRPRQAVAVHPLLRGPLLQTAERTVYAVDLAGPGRWVVDDHRLADGRLLLPGAAHAELARAIAARHFGAAAIEVADLVFAAPLVLRPDEPREVFAVAGPGPGPGTQLELAVVSRGGEPGAWQEHARCTLRPASGSAPPRVALDEVLARCPEPRQRSPAGRLLRFGPRWSEVAVHAWLGTAEGLASFELPPALAGDLAEIGLHPALLDLATGWAGSLAGGSFLPLSYGRLRVWAPLPARIWSFARLAGDAAPGRETLAFDLTLLAPDGEVLAEIDDFTVKRVREGAMLAGPAAQLPGRTAAAGPPALYADLITAAERTAAALAHGIRPAEGYEVLRRVLARPLPPLVIVSTRDLQALLQREPPAFGPAAPRPETAAAVLAAPAAAHPRPALSTPYAPSGDGIEGSLAEIWQRVLGIERIGVNDNFFELGGDSIAGLQVVAAAGRAGLELPPRLLFEHPTIAGLASAVERESAAAAGHGPAPVAALPAAPAVPPAAAFPAAALAPGDWERLAAQLEVREPPRPDQPAEVDHATGQRR